MRVTNPQTAVENMARQFKINYPIGIANDKIMDRFPPFQAIPTAFVFDKDGKQVKTLMGFNTEDVFDEIIKGLL